MWKNKPTGIKILWVWTIGTAVVLLSTVSRTRVRDMDKLMDEAELKQQQQQQQQQHQYKDVSSGIDNVMVDNELIREDKS